MYKRQIGYPFSRERKVLEHNPALYADMSHAVKSKLELIPAMLDSSYLGSDKAIEQTHFMCQRRIDW